MLFKRDTAMAYKNITAEKLKKIQEENPNAIVLDVRIPADVRQGKTPGAANLEVAARNINRIAI